MEVSVKLVSTFLEYEKNLDQGKATLNDGETVGMLAEKIGLPMKYVRLVFINGKQVDLGSVLSQGDNIYFVPPALGGG